MQDHVLNKITKATHNFKPQQTSSADLKQVIFCLCDRVSNATDAVNLHREGSDNKDIPVS